MARLARLHGAPKPRLLRLADEDLMRLVAASDAAAFEVVFERHVDAAFSLAYRMSGRRGLADEIVQEAFLSIWRSAGRYDRARASVRTWVLGIIHNRAVDALRRSDVHDRRRASADGLDEVLEASQRTEDEVGRKLEATEIRDALAELPSEQARVIELAYFGGFTHTEIANMLELSVGTVKGRMRLGLQKLRSQLAVAEGVG
jgi:RNA polymerase sigma-70 factor (ECF subfamily)